MSHFNQFKLVDLIEQFKEVEGDDQRTLYLVTKLIELYDKVNVTEEKFRLVKKEFERFWFYKENE